MQVKRLFFSLTPFALIFTMILVCITPVIGQDEAPDFTLFDINRNKDFSLSDYRGRVVLIDLFRMKPSCPPCIYEIPHLKGVYDKYSESDVVMMSISVSSLDSADSLRSDFVEEYDIPWIVACGGTQMASNYGVSGVPTLVIIDGEGNIGYRHEGVTDKSTLISEIDSLLSGAEDGASNGDSDGDSDGAQPGISLELVGLIGVAVAFLLVIGIVVAGRALEWSKPAKMRGKD